MTHTLTSPADMQLWSAAAPGTTWLTSGKLRFRFAHNNGTSCGLITTVRECFVDTVREAEKIPCMRQEAALDHQKWLGESDFQGKQTCTGTCPSAKCAAAAVSQIEIGSTGRLRSHVLRVIWLQEVFSNISLRTTELTHLIRSDEQRVTKDQDQLNKMYIDVAAVARRVREAKESRDLYLHDQVIVLNCQQCRLPVHSTCGVVDQVSAVV